jgi:nicotinate-nucleotide adenylyltransferase
VSPERRHNPMRIGIFGGSFDPPHNGHISIATHAAEHLNLDRTFLVPSSVPPHKLEQELSSPEDRLAMCRLAVMDSPLLSVSDVELRREGVSYSVDTLNGFSQLFPGSELFMLIGMDNYLEFHLWRDPALILELATVVVMDRPGYRSLLKDSPQASRIRRVEAPQIDVSSTQIRRLVRRGEPISGLVPRSVEEYIDAHRLYR